MQGTPRDIFQVPSKLPFKKKYSVCLSANACCHKSDKAAVRMYSLSSMVTNLQMMPGDLSLLQLIPRRSTSVPLEKMATSLGRLYGIIPCGVPIPTPNPAFPKLCSPNLQEFSKLSASSISSIPCKIQIASAADCV